MIVYFTTSRAEFEAELGNLRAHLAPAGGLWIAWPKRAAKVPTDMSDHAVREIALPACGGGGAAISTRYGPGSGW